MTRRVRLDPGVLGDLSPALDAERWRQRLHQAGLLTELDHRPQDDDHPACWIAALQDALRDLGVIEAALAEARRPLWFEGLKVSQMKQMGIVAVGGVLVVALARPDEPLRGWGDLFEMVDGVRRMMFVGVALGVAAAVGLVVFSKLRNQQRSEIARLTAERDELVAQLAEGCGAILGRTFVIRAAHAIIESLPRLREIRRERERGDPAAAARLVEEEAELLRWAADQPEGS